MTNEELQKLEESKRRVFKRMFGDRYGVRLIELRLWINDDGREFGQVNFSICETMTAMEIGEMCRKMAKWLDGELYGTVNIDYTDEISPVIEMMVEIRLP